MKKRNTQLRIILILVFAVLAGGLFLILDSRKKYNQWQHLQLVTEKFQLAHNTIYDQYKQMATFIYSGLSYQFDIQEVYQQLLTANEEEKNRLRQELLFKIRPRFEQLQKQIMINHIHFHLPDSTSFLRLHNPEEYGDNLTNTRELVNYVNTFHIPADGFEMGLSLGNFRFVFPVTSADRIHLGSVEISYGPEALISSMMNQYDVISNFLIKDKGEQTQPLSDSLATIYQESPIQGFLFDNNVLEALQEISGKDIKDLMPEKTVLDAIFAHTLKDQAVSLYANTINSIITILPVRNSATKKTDGFFVIQSKSDLLLYEIKKLRVIFLLSLLLLILTFLIFFQQFSKKNILEHNAKTLIKQKNLLMDAQNIAHLGHWEMDVATYKTTWSELIYQIFDLQPSANFAPSTKTFLTVVHPDDRVLVKSAYTDSVKNHQAYDLQHRIITSAGVEKWIRQRGATEYDKSGKPVRSFGNVQDITESKQTELDLVESRHRLQFALHAAQAGTFYYDIQSDSLELDERSMEIFGVEPETFGADSDAWAAALLPEDYKRVYPIVQAAIDNRTSFDNEFRIVLSNGVLRHVRGQGYAIVDETGTPSALAGIYYDITRKKEEEKGRHEARKITRMILDNAVVGIALIDSNRLIVQTNRYLVDLFGYPEKELVGQSTRMMYESEESYLELGREIYPILTSGAIFESDVKMRHKDGTIFPVHLRGRLVDVDNPSRGSIWSLEDVSNRYAAEERLRDYSKKLQTTTDNVPGVIFRFYARNNGEAGVSYVSPKLFDIFGLKIIYDPPLLLKTFVENIHENDRQSWIDSVEEAVIKQMPFKWQGRYVRPSGKMIWFEAKSTPVVGVDEISFDGILTDITEQKKIEQQLIEAQQKSDAANQAKSDFLANMSHELRTPLNAILGYTQLFARDKALDANQQKGITTIHQAGEHLLMLINDILDLSKIEASKMELVTSKFRLSEFLRGIEDIIRMRANDRGIDFRCEYEQPLPDIIEADELRLRQVILNLLSNAIKFTEKGHCTLRIQSRSTDREDRVLLTVTVEDSGVGIVPEMQQKVFDPFQQTGDRLQYAEGSGLGLSICRQLTHLMGGALRLASPVTEQPPPGEGPGTLCFFAIVVPVPEHIFEKQEEQKIAGYTVAGESNAQKKILVVDDKPSNRTVLRDTLESFGFIIEEASDGSETLASCKQFFPDAILMDLRMPKIDGFTACKQIKSHPDFAHVPVIAITASGNSSVLRQRCLDHEFNGYLTKPCSVNKLLKTLAELLNLQLSYYKDTGKSTEAKEMAVPPQEVLDSLFNLAQAGDISGVLSQASELAILESGKYSGFANRIKKLADKSQLMAIEDLLQEG